VVALGASLAEVLGATVFRDRWWGAHSWGFLPPASLWIAGACLAVGLLLARLAPARLDGGLVRALSPAPRLPSGVTLALASLASGLLFWTFREAHTFLGDGNPLTRNLARGQSFHPDEPLSLALHHAWYGFAGRWFAAPGRSPVEVAHATVGLSSAICGMFFVPIVWMLAGDLLRRGPAAPGHDARGERAARVLVFGVLLAQGSLQLFFGYVENYTFLALALAAYALAALRAFEGRAPLALAAVVLVFALGLHLSAAVLVPSFAVLVAHRLLDPRGRGRAARDLVIGAAVFAAMHALLARLGSGYDWTGMLLKLGRSATDSRSSYGFNPPNAGQFLNQQILIGPLGIFLLAPAFAVALRLRAWRHARDLFLAALVVGYVAASFIAGDSNLGVARNWDLLAPAGFVFTLAALGFALRAAWPAPELRRWLFVLAIISLFHTVAWIAVNASMERTIARFEVLPLGLGRAQAVLGEWYLSQGREAEAVGWFRRSLDENPLNNNAAYQLGRIAMRHADWAFAARAFAGALQARPTMGVYRFALVDALVRARQLVPARAQLDTLLGLEPEVPAYRAASAMLWLELAERDRARSDLLAVERLAPEDSLVGVMRRRFESDSAAASLLRDVWPQLVPY
jgi:tetratricopeptide (TPR) repeat protein